VKPRPSRARILILSFSRLTVDARILTQITFSSETYDVDTCGFGDAPAGVATHYSIPTGLSANRPYSRLLRLRLFGIAYWRMGAVRWARRALKDGRWDAIIANDPETLPLAMTLGSPRHVLADLHEYSPRMREDLPGWSHVYRPYYEWLCRRFASRAGAASTVSRGLANEYANQFGFTAVVLPNATPYREGSPQPTGQPLRLVHSGAGLPNRGLELMIDAVENCAHDVTLDLYLVPSNIAVMERLRARTARSPRVRLHDPVAYDQLVSTLSEYDVGVFVLPPATFSYAHALPNKLFDFVQARLAIIVGPTPEMAELVREHDLGFVTADFSAEALCAVLEAVSRDDIDQAKAASSRAARALASENLSRQWQVLVDRLVTGGRTG